MSLSCMHFCEYRSSMSLSSRQLVPLASSCLLESKAACPTFPHTPSRLSAPSLSDQPPHPSLLDSLVMRQLVTLENEQHARAAGRAFAKQVFGRVRWTRLGAVASNTDVKLYESAASGTPAAEGRYTVRAVRRVRASIAEVEVVLATAARYGALAVLLPGAYASGGLGAEFGEVHHATSEREHTSVEFARLRPYAGILGMEHHVLLSYTLATVLQRTRRSHHTGTNDRVAVPAVLHLLRPVDYPEVARKRRDFQRDYLALNAFSITYIAQETSTRGVVELEVLLACSDDEQSQPLVRRGPTQKQRMWQDAVTLTGIAQLVENLRASRSGGPTPVMMPTVGSMLSTVDTTGDDATASLQSRSTRSATLPTQTTEPATPATLATPQSSSCCICHKRFGPFRWKHQCDVCLNAACDRCLSVLAANPTASVRKKTRLCRNCLYGPRGLGTSHVPPQDFQSNDMIAPTPTPAPTVFAGARGPAGTDRRYSAPPPTRAMRSGGRAVPPPVPEYDPTSKRLPSRSRASSRASSRSGSSVYSDSDDDGGDAFVAPVRARRAQTVTIDETPCRPVATSTRSFRMAPSYRSSFTNTPRARVESEPTPLTTLVPPELMRRTTTTTTTMTGTTASSTGVLELRTPAADYELDFDWLNIFPKAPVPPCDAARVYFLDTALKLDPQAVVFLRHDSGLETLAHRVLDTAASHGWLGCSINVVSKRHVYCLINASAEMDAASGRPAVVVDDMMPRAESASSYAVYHNTPFFVPALATDDRFRAHPLVTDHSAGSLLSFPLYAASGVAGRVQAQCLGTLDLWTLDALSSDCRVSRTWWTTMETIAGEVSTRVQELAKESGQFLKARPTKAYSIDSSSCDSRTSTRQDDSFELDQFQFEPDGGDDSYGHGNSPPFGAANFFVKGRSHSRTSLGGDLASWRFSSSSQSHSVDNSDNESTTSSCSNSSRTSNTSSRYSSRYSAAELHSAIESLLHQANETSSMVYSTSVTV